MITRYKLLVCLLLMAAGILFVFRTFSNAKAWIDPNDDTAISSQGSTDIDEIVIVSPPHPPQEYADQRKPVTLPKTDRINGIVTLSVPTYEWVFGCSAVSGAMIAAYYDRNGLPNTYTGPTNGGVMPLDSSIWPTWSDGTDTYPNNPLVASHNGIDGRTTRGSIDDYWIQYLSSAQDPYITNGWTQHTWGDAIGDYMKTSQSAYSNVDGSTSFYNYTNGSQLSCSDMVTHGISSRDGTYGRKLFYEARGYAVTDCYSQYTDNNGGGYTFSMYMAEINAGNPVMLNLEGHTIVGVGYNSATNTVYLNDTWDFNTHTMTWGGSYSGMELQSVSIVHLNTPTPPGAFNKSSPADASTGVSISPTLSWGSSSGATSYEYCYDTTNDNACSSWVNNGMNTSVALSGLSNGATYYWHVRANNAGGTTYSDGSTTAYWSFTTIVAAPGAFNKSSPADASTGVSTSPTLSWGSSSGATSYEYCYDATNDDACSSWVNNGTNTSVALSGLSNGATYYWQVRANNAGGTTYSDGSTTAYWSFTTIVAAPGAFNKSSPADASTGVSISPTLSWGSSSGATSYEYCYDTTDDNACSSWVNNGTNTSVALSGLSNGATYYWQVRSSNVSGMTYADNGIWWSFSTIPTCYALTTGVSPSGSGSVSASPTPNCGSQYTSGTVVTLTATANSGYSFSNWSGDASGSSNPTTVTMDSDKSVTADFTTSGVDLIFEDGFESGDFSAWSSATVDGGDLSVTSAAALVGGYGTQALLNDNNSIYVQDQTPAAEARYRARFYLDPNSMSMASGNSFYLLVAYNTSSRWMTTVTMRYFSGAYQVQFSISNDAYSWTNSAWITISDAPHYLEFDWQAATAAGANDGSLTCWIDGVQRGSLTGIDNDTYRIERVSFGAVYGVDTGTRGTLYLDEFESRRATYIGAVPSTCYTLTTGVSPSGSGSVSASPTPNCGSQYTSGTVVTLTATANSGYSFLNWSGDASGSSNPTTVTMDSDKSVTANFSSSPTCYTLTTGVSPSGSGSVSASPTPNCGSQFTSGTVVTLTATANSGYSFSNWSGDASGSSNPTTVTMDSDKSVTANFTTSGVDLIFEDGFESGDFSAWSSATVDGGDLSVTSAAALVGGYGTQALLNDNNSIYVQDQTPAAEARYRARFYLDPNSMSMASGNAFYLLITYNANSRWMTTVTMRYFSGVYQVQFSISNDAYSWTNSAWITISDAPHYLEFDWQAATAAGANDGSLTCWIDGVQRGSLTGIDNDTYRIERVSFGAVYGVDTGTRGTFYLDEYESRRATYIGAVPSTCYTLTTGVSPSGGGSVSASPTPNCGSQYTSGTVVTLTATANSGYSFSSWSGDASGSSNPTTVTMDSDKSVTANFSSSPTCYTLTTGVNPSGSGSVSASPTPNCGSQFTSGTVVTLTATANSGYSFSNWSGDASGSSNPTTVTMDSDKSVTADFTTSGVDLIFEDGFEGGDFSAWSSATVDGGDLSVTSAAALVGGYGTQALLNDNNSIYVQDQTPAAEARYRARFYLDPNSMSMASGNSFYLLVAYNTSSRWMTTVTMRYFSGVYQVQFSISNDAYSWTNSAWITISDAPHYLEFDWQAATAAGANDGSLTCWIDGVQRGSLTGIDNDTYRIERVSFGAVYGVDTGTSGTFYLDEYESHRTTYIGP